MSEKTMEAALHSRIRGCLYGGAVGDALGYPVEFYTIEMILDTYGPQGIQAYVPDGGFARITDDTQMTLFTCEGIILGWNRAMEKGISATPEQYIYQGYLAWMRTQGFPCESLWTPVSRLLKYPEMHALRAPGNTCLSALDSGEMGTLDAPLNSSKGCGGVMRVAPLGLLPDKRSEVMMNGAKTAAITHGHPLGFIPGAMLAGIVHALLYSRYSSLYYVVEKVLNETVKLFKQYEEIHTFEKLIRRAIRLSLTAKDDVQAIHSLGGGWVGDEALAIAIYCALKYSRDFTAAVIAAVNHSGDADSTGAITGNILGAYLGYDAIGDRWLQNLELKDAIEEMAEGMFRIAWQKVKPHQ